MDEKNEFQITIFSDLHYGEEENGWGIDQDVSSTKVMNAILDFEDSDLVVLSKYLYIPLLNLSLVYFPLPDKVTMRT